LYKSSTIRCKNNLERSTGPSEEAQANLNEVAYLPLPITLLANIKRNYRYNLKNLHLTHI